MEEVSDDEFFLNEPTFEVYPYYNPSLNSFSFHIREFFTCFDCRVNVIVNEQEPETEAVSDEELPAAAPADLGETESVSEDELPPDADKKKKSSAKAAAKLAEKKSKADAGGKYIHENFKRKKRICKLVR